MLFITKPRIKLAERRVRNLKKKLFIFELQRTHKTLNLSLQREQKKRIGGSDKNISQTASYRLTLF